MTKKELHDRIITLKYLSVSDLTLKPELKRLQEEMKARKRASKYQAALKLVEQQEARLSQVAEKATVYGKINSIQSIKDAVYNGRVVHYMNENYTVKEENNNFFIENQNKTRMPLSASLNTEDFFLEEV